MTDGGGPSGQAGEFGEFTDEEVLGQLGTVTTRIRGGELPGEVLVTVRGGREEFIAYADRELDPGTTVLVVTWRGHRCVDVIPY